MINRTKMSENLIVTNKKERIQYIDALRGFTMILVVFAHVETFTFQLEDTFLGNLFISFRMPLFFFISGFIGYKSVDYWNRGNCLKQIKRKIVALIIPAIVIGLLYTYLYVKQDFQYFVSSPFKSGYWFTLVLFQMYLLYYLVARVSNTILCKYDCDFFLMFLGVGLIIVFVSYEFLSARCNSCLNYTSFNLTAKYFVYFAFGLVCRRYYSLFEKIINNKMIYTIILLFFTFLYCLYQLGGGIWESSLVLLLQLILGFLGILLVFSIFFHYQDSFSNRSFSGKCIQYIGRHTLDIYLLHYFLLPSIPGKINLLSLSQNIILELGGGLSLSVFIIVLCLLLSRIIRISPLLSYFLFGERVYK